jgi:hypothetical protein
MRARIAVTPMRAFEAFGLPSAACSADNATLHRSSLLVNAGAVWQNDALSRVER